ncbi:hypothetical protein BH20PSE1_BH20PSE1_00970 [soil metagenome]
MTINRAQPLNDLGPWGLGINNVASDYALAQGELRDAVNVDITLQGHPRRRKGYTSRYTGTAVHSSFSDGATLYGVTGGNLSWFTRATDGTLTPTTIRTGFPTGRPLAYLHFKSPLDYDRIYYSNGLTTGMLVNRVSYPWGVERPSGQPLVAAAAAGGLDAGTYQVAATFVSVFGEESGSGESARVTVAQGGGITLSAVPQPASGSGVTRVLLYCSEANGAIPYLHTSLPVGTTSAVISRSLSLGRPLETQFMGPPPPGDVLELHYGRIYIASGSVLRWTEALRPGGYRERNFMLFQAPITLIASTTAGLIIAADRTYFLPGGDPRAMGLVDRLPYGAFRGTLVRDPRREALYWVTPKGLCMASYGGEIRNLSDGRIALRDGARGAGFLREGSGLRQYIGVVRGGESDALQADDF